MATFKVENSAQVLSCKLKFVHGRLYKNLRWESSEWSSSHASHSWASPHHHPHVASASLLLVLLPLAEALLLGVLKSSNGGF